MRRKLMEDEMGVNVLVEYIINFSVLLVLLTLVMLLYQSIIVNSGNIIAHEEYRIFANDIANRIVYLDMIAKSTTTQSDTLKDLEVTFNTPGEIAGMSYTIEIGQDGVEKYVKVSSADRSTIDPIKATFNTSYNVSPNPTIIYGSPGHHKILFNNGSKTIEVQ